MIRSVITGCGSYLPARVIDNRQIAEMVDTTDEWIRDRTGITKRYIAADDEMTSDIAYKASEIALKDAGIISDDIDLIIVATTTPDNTFPSTATRVQALIGNKRGAAFDVQAVCSGFIYALATANNFIKTGQSKKILVIGADILSRIVDWKDRGTCILFGDGAGAIVLEARENTDSGILSTHLYSDGTTRNLLYVDGGVASTGTIGKLRMEGKDVFKHAVQKMSECTKIALEANNIHIDEIDWVIPHQANKRILESAIKKLGIPMEKLISTVEIHANTSAASIPLALDVAKKDGRIKRGDLIAMQALGGGLTWGAALLRW